MDEPTVQYSSMIQCILWCIHIGTHVSLHCTAHSRVLQLVHYKETLESTCSQVQYGKYSTVGIKTYILYSIFFES